MDDLAEGERATPEPGVTYDLRKMDNRMVASGTVQCVFRDGDTLFARTTEGEIYPVIVSWKSTQQVRACALSV